MTMQAIVNDATGEVEFILEDASGYDLAGRTVRDVTDADFMPAAIACRWREIKAARDAAEWGGVDTPYGRFDSDEESQGKLNGAVTAALVFQAQGIAFSKDWTLADNSSVTLTGPQMIEVGLTVLGWVDAVHQRSRVLRERLETTITPAAAQAIEWGLTDD